MLGRFRKNRVLKSYINKLPGFLKKDYGSSKQYTVGQIRSSIERYGLNNTYAIYAYIMFAHKDDIMAQVDANVDYSALRSEVADKYFHGNENFSMGDMGSAVFSSGDMGAGDSN